MPRLDYAVLADYVRVEGGVAHVIAAGVDTIYAPELPTGQNLGLLFRILFTRNECGRPHRFELILQDIDGERLTHLTSVITPEWKEGVPVGWDYGLLGGLNFGIPLPRYGLYSFEILINDQNLKTIQLRVEPVPAEMLPSSEEPPDEPDMH
jgi:hypothetical protein